MDFTLFPEAFAIQKREEHDRFKRERDAAMYAECQPVRQACDKKIQKLKNKFYIYDDYVTYLKAMALVYTALLVVAGMIFGPVLILNMHGSEAEGFGLVLLAILGVLGGAVVGALGGVACCVTTVPVSVIISPIFFFIFRAVVNAINNKREKKMRLLEEEKTGRLGLICLPYITEVEAHKQACEKEIEEYTALFEQHALFFAKNAFADNPMIEEISAWLKEKFLEEIRNQKRTADVECIEVALSYTVYKTKVAYKKEAFVFADHRVKNLDNDLQKASLALAILPVVDSNLVWSFVEFESDADRKLTPQHSYTGSANAPTFTITLTYTARNTAFVPLTEWQVSHEIHDQK